MTSQHQSLVAELGKTLLAESRGVIGVVPFLTRLESALEADEAAVALSTAPGSFTLMSAIEDQIDVALSGAGNMAHNNIQGEEARRAHEVFQAPTQYAAFDWKPLDASADPASRLTNILAGVKAIAVAVNTPPPAPPTYQQLVEAESDAKKSKATKS